MRSSTLPAACLFSLLPGIPAARAGSGTVKLFEVSTGFHLTLNASKGRFELGTEGPSFSFGGSLGAPLDGLGNREGRDGIGAFRAVVFSWWDGGPRRGEIRLYRERRVFLLLESWPEGAEKPLSTFPVFDRYPRGLTTFCYRDRSFSPPRFGLERTSSPWFFYRGDGSSFLVSPASRFMVAEMRKGKGNAIVSGLREELRNLPPGYDHATILAVGKGINRTWDIWGRALTDFQGKKRPGPYADVGLRCLGYWTDNGAAYYYHFDPRKGYEKTLLDVMKTFREEGIPYGYLQLDSWFYPKTFTGWDLKKPSAPRPKNPRLPAGRWNRYGGMLLYEGDPGVFPRGIGEFRKKLGLPLVTHNRWIDPESPYRKSYRVSGVGAVDPAWWDHVIGNLASWGVVTYEQDWLNVIYALSPEMRTTVWAGSAFMDQMARACKDKGLTMQYCMAQPRHFLQGSRYGNLTTIRVSGDRFRPRAWAHALFTSRLACSLGIYPWVDVFRSSELGNILLACLSAGMVGPGDALGEEDLDDLSRAARTDGVLVKPDAPILPVDETWTALGKKGFRGGAPITAATYTDFGSFKAWYVFAFNPGKKRTVVEVPPPSLGIRGRCYVWAPFLGSGSFVDAKRPLRYSLEGRGRGGKNWAYFLVAPVLENGLCLLGDPKKFVSLGKKRVSRVEVGEKGIQVEVLFAEGEKEVVLLTESLEEPTAKAEVGKVVSLSWNEESGRTLLLIAPGPSGKARIEISLR